MSIVAASSNSQAFQYLQANPVSNVNTQPASHPANNANSASAPKVHAAAHGSNSGSSGQHIDTYA